jgi:hypothetical protein
MTNQDLDANPKVDQWSNGVNQADQLNQMMKVRRAALDRMGEHTIRNGAPMAMIEEPLVPIFHVSPVFGGIRRFHDWRAGLHLWMRGDARTPVKWESAVNQHKALDALAATLKPAELTVPKQILDLIPPRPPGYGHEPRVISTHHGRWFRSAESGDNRLRCDNRLRAATGSRGANGGAACGGSHAARSRRSDRPADEGNFDAAAGESVRG